MSEILHISSWVLFIGSAALQDSVASIRGIHTYRHLCVIEKYHRGQGLCTVELKVEAWC
jgi:hypothetical protein